jgi:uncharacterized membrane protein YgcG
MTQVCFKWIAFSFVGVLACAMPGCTSFLGGWHQRSFAIPERYPLGSINRAHYHTMQANAEAADFILHRNEFVGKSAELSPYGKDHIVEIAARMRSTPFPVLIERSENNSDPELDEHRRKIMAQILTDFGVPEADQRTIVSRPYGRAINSRAAEIDYGQWVFSRSSNNFGGIGNGSGQNGGGGGGGVGGFGFGR